ncbi:hypothetical protein, partial [Nonomuraea sp. NPDC049784]|uniref:hypothetical protein n=1 Tax=Nonomuraea sp. NPDC049784 TaxID=3154361 RepID=UPI0033DB34B3
MNTDVAAIDAALAQLGYEVERLDKRVCLLSLAAIAHHVRATFPEAVTLGLSWNDYAIHVVPAGYYNAAGELLGQLPEQESDNVGVFGVFSPVPPGDLLDETTEPYCSNLKWTNRAVWEPFTTDVHPATGRTMQSGDLWLDLTRALTIPTGIISPATVQAFVDWAEQAGITPEDLDDYVHDLASEPASDTNNGGLHDQITFMIESCGEDGARDLLVRCEPEKPRPGHAI